VICLVSQTKNKNIKYKSKPIGPRKKKEMHEFAFGLKQDKTLMY
jgi:hypothetical protein